MHLVLVITLTVASAKVRATLGPSSVPRAEASASYIKPDECPERDEFLAGNKGRTCQRKCDGDNDCLNDRKLCLCDGECGLSCIRPEKECQELPDPPHGQVHLTGRHFNDRAVYTCDEGYQIVGLEHVICNSDGHWSGSQPSCKQASSNAQSRYYCGEPKHIPNAKHNGSKEQLFYDLDTEVTYTCLTGYKRKGFQEAQCFFYNESARWFGPDLSCHPIDCGTPEDIINGKRKGDCTTYRCQITYECVPGFDLVGKDTRYCQSDGTWTPSELPSCVPVQCPIPNRPTNGNAMYTAVAYKSVVSYKCNRGHMIVGNATRTCGEDKQWSGSEPECKEINCGSPGFLANGWLEGSSTKLNMMITYKCIDGMTFEGPSATTICQANGTWSHPLPKCQAPCIVPDITKGTVLDRSIGSSLHHGENITVKCEPRYELAQNSTPIFCRNGTWSQIPKCEPARCKSLPPPPLDGMVVVPRTNHGGIGLYQCKDGYVLKGPNITRCHFGNWSDITPRCELVYCPFPGYIEKGKVLLVGNMGLYDYRPYVRKVKNNRQIVFECGRGSKLAHGPPGATCIDGRWSPSELPKCVDEFHPKMVQWKRRKRSATPADHFLPRASLRIKRALRRREVTAALHVLPSKSNNFSALAAGECPEILDENMKQDVLESTQSATNPNSSVPMVIRVSCGQGYELNISKKKVRCKRGNWKPAHPECVPLKCRLPQIFVGGKFKLDSIILPNEGEIEHGKEVDLECDPGYYRSGPDRRRCWYGEWTGNAETPKCVGNPCRLPEIPGGGKYIGNGGNYRPGQLIPHNALIDFECDDLKKVLQPLQCIRGNLLPHPPECYLTARASADEQVYDQHSSDLRKWLSSLAVSASSHIIKNGDLTSATGKNYFSGLENDFGSNALRLTRHHHSCVQPENVKGSLVYYFDSQRQHHEQHMRVDGAQFKDSSIHFPHGTEVRFECMPSLDSAVAKSQSVDQANYKAERRTWKITCQEGKWIGEFLTCNADGTPRLTDEESQPAFNASCFYLPTNQSESNVVVHHENREILRPEHFSPGAELVYRCRDIGKYHFSGSKRRRCIGGVWDGHEPVCQGLNQLYDYDTQRPPTILFRRKNGEIAQTHDGRLVVTPGTIVHMECLWRRKYGTPQWTVDTFSGRTYPQDWTSAPGRDAALEYRVSIYHARINDTGTYACKTPKDKEHIIHVIVQDIKCPPLAASVGLVISDNSRRLNSLVTFNCSNGNDLIGPSEVQCLASGQWSAPLPTCLKNVCPKGIFDTLSDHLHAEVISLGVGGVVRFSCSSGYKLQGPSEANCRHDGKWSVHEKPKCVPITCPPPKVPQHGSISGSEPYKIGERVKFNCESGYMLFGQPIAHCLVSGKWSSLPSRCQRACTYPGGLLGGTIDKVKFYYSPGEAVSFDCAQGLVMVGPRRIECLPNGAWSSIVPKCNRPQVDN